MKRGMPTRPTPRGLVEQPMKKWHDIDTGYFKKLYGYEQIVSQDSLNKNYTEPTQFVDDKTFYPKHRYGEAFGGQHKEVQVRSSAPLPFLPPSCPHQAPVPR